MPLNIFELLPKLTDDMPRWAKITAFFVVLFLAVYLYLAPTFVDGQVVGQTANGGFIPYRGVDINVNIDSRTLKFKTNEDGYWSVPLVSRLPDQVRLMVYHEDDHAFYEVVIDSFNVWTGDFRILVQNDPPGMELTTLASTGSGWSRHLAQWLGITNTVAGELVIENAEIDPLEQQKVSQTVADLVAQALGTRSSELNESHPLSGRGAPRYLQRIQIVQSVENQYGITIPDEHWRSLHTLAELADYVYKRQLLHSKTNEQPEGVNVNWNQMQQQYDPATRPKYVPDSSPKQ